MILFFLYEVYSLQIDIVLISNGIGCAHMSAFDFINPPFPYSMNFVPSVSNDILELAQLVDCV